MKASRITRQHSVAAAAVVGRGAVVSVDVAYSFAVRAHGDQRYGTEPYSVHLEEVMSGCIRLGFTDDKFRVAAALHDVIEDTDVDEAGLAAAFGHEIARVVAELSHDRRVETCDYLAAMSDTAFCVKLADRLANVERMGLLENSPDRAAYLLAKYGPEMALFKDEAARRGLEGPFQVLAAAMAQTTAAIRGAVDEYTLQQGRDRVEEKHRRAFGDDGPARSDGSAGGAAHASAMGGKRPLSSSSPLFVRAKR